MRGKAAVLFGLAGCGVSGKPVFARVWKTFLTFELLMQQSGGMLEASSLASPCNASRTTLQNYLYVLEDTYAVTVLRPFFSNKSKEITAAPKFYGFDTGFVAFHKGWTTLRSEDRGMMWEHIVLNNYSHWDCGTGFDIGAPNKSRKSILCSLNAGSLLWLLNANGSMIRKQTVTSL